MPDDDLIVEVEAPAPVAAEATPEPKPEATPKPAPKAVAPDPVVDLKAQLETMRADKTAEATARQRAEADAAAARAEAATAKSAVVDSNISAVDSAIAAAQAEADGFARDQEAALAAGKFADAALAARKAARAEARIESLEQGKVNLTARKAEAPKQPAQSVEQSAFDKAIANSPPRSQAWLRSHPDYVTNTTLNNKANAAHYSAVSTGLQPDTDEYFDYVERQLGLKAEPAAAEVKPKPTPRAAALPGAPVSRDGGPSSGQLSATSVTLTPGEQARATDGSLIWNYSDPKIGAIKGQPIGLKEYARRKIAMTQSGMYDRSYTEQ